MSSPPLSLQNIGIFNAHDGKNYYFQFFDHKKSKYRSQKNKCNYWSTSEWKKPYRKTAAFFRTFSTEFYEGIRKDRGKRETDKALLDLFEKRFPRYTWDGASFSIIYELNDISIKISGRKNSSGKTSLSISYSDQIVKIYNSKKKTFARKLAEARAEERPGRRTSFIENQVFYDCVVEPLRDGAYGKIFGSPIFIPATRSFFANLQKNIFTFLASNLDIDPYLKEFGSLYESSKRWYKDAYLGERKKQKNS